jgi:phytoene dehydrogenase-like protein
LTWPFAESDEEIGRWGVETELANVWLCGAGARRGGGVSGIPGHNAAMAVLAARR